MSSASSPELVLAPAGELPSELSAPLAAATAGGCLHVVGASRVDAGSLQLALDPSGHALGPARAIPLIVSSLVAAGSELVAAASEPGADAPVLAGLDPRSGVRWVRPLPCDRQLASWPQLVADGERAWAVWLEGIERPALRWTQVARGELGPVRTEPLDGGVPDVAVGPGPLVARTRADGLECARVGDHVPLAWSRVAGGEEAEPWSPAVAALGDGFVVAWIAPAAREARLRLLGGAGRAAFTVATAGPGEELRSVRLMAEAGGLLAVSLLVTRPGAGVLAIDQGGGRLRTERGLEVRQLVGTIAPDAGAAVLQEIANPGVLVDQGDWLDGRLVLVHGGERLSVTVGRQA